MRRIVLWLVATATVVILVFGYRTSTSGPSPSGSAGGGGGQPPGVVSGGGADAVVNGPVAATRWGPVQVRVTIAGGRITEVTPLQQPSGTTMDVEINKRALPRLRAEVLQAQSAKIATISGATVTSDGYVSSLQAALTAAHFKS